MSLFSYVECFFFFKQKTAYEMRISDWSSDVCSSDLAATTEQEDINATIAITGSAQDPHIAFTSTPALPQDEVLSRLLFGSSPENLSATEAIQLAAALNSLRGGGGGLNPLGTLRSATGIDRLDRTSTRLNSRH